MQYSVSLKFYFCYTILNRVKKKEKENLEGYNNSQ